MRIKKTAKHGRLVACSSEELDSLFDTYKLFRKIEKVTRGQGDRHHIFMSTLSGFEEFIKIYIRGLDH